MGFFKFIRNLFSCASKGDQENDKTPYDKLTANKEPENRKSSSFYSDRLTQPNLDVIEQNKNITHEKDSTFRTTELNETSAANTANISHEQNISESESTQPMLKAIEQDENNTHEENSTLETAKLNETSNLQTANNTYGNISDQDISKNELIQPKLDAVEKNKNNTHEIVSDFQRAPQVKRQKKNPNKIIIENIPPEPSNTSSTVSNNDELKDNNTENLSEQLMSSTNLEIKSCGEAIHKIFNELKVLKLFHKTTNYKRLDRELFKMMVKLDDIEVNNDSIVREERRKALTEIHELIKLLDSKIQCKITDCMICKTGIELKKDKINVPVLESEIN